MLLWHKVVKLNQNQLYSHELKTMNRQRLLDRFLEYVQIDTTAVEDTDNYPSSPGQMEMGKVMYSELTESKASPILN